ncbi:MAG: THUMP domain-containing class I SAM-dependent RNA methyltransferase [Janthinobacterium lividum]
MAFHLFAPCPRGLEAPLAAELRELTAHAPGLVVGEQGPGGVHFRGDLNAAAAANLHSRIASRILLRLGHGAYRNEDDVYALAREQRWEDWFDARCTLRVDVTAIKSPLRSLEFATLRVKDAICDRLRELTGARPDIDTATPDVRVFVFLTANHCTLYLDTSGEPLFKRGWRLDKGAAPLRENLAAGILRLSGWTPGTPLYDPMCGSGTFLAEAAQIALGVPSGSDRHFAFEKFKTHDAKAWRLQQDAALDARDAAAARPANAKALGIFGSDISSDMLVKARANLARAGLPPLPLKQLDARGMTLPVDAPGVMIVNPPYGERIDVRGRSSGGRDDDDGSAHARSLPEAPDEAFYLDFGSALKKQFVGWRAFILTPDRLLPRQLRLREAQKTPLFNGAIECRLFRFDMFRGSADAQ